MDYMPQISNARTAKRIPLSTMKHTALLLDNIESAGSVKYLYILAIFDHATEEPCLFIASEENLYDSESRSGSHFLGLFPGNGHRNLGCSDDWADIEKFEKRSVELAEEYLTNKS